MTGDFIQTYSTNNIWRDEDFERCLTLDLEAIEADVAALESGKADANHSHSGYASANHSHDEYANEEHTHSEYAASNHEHTGYAAANHEHDYALPEHTHDDVVTLAKLTNIMSTHHDMVLTATAGENYSSVSGSATLVGNMLRVRLTANRNTAASGNIDNETVANVSIAHGGKITGGYAVTFGTGTSGHISNMVTSSVACNETALTFRVTLTATAGDTSALNPFFAMPVIIDLSKF